MVKSKTRAASTSGTQLPARGRIDLRAAGDQVWMQQFNALDLPPLVAADNSVSEPRITALDMLLRRLAYPIRLEDVEMMLGWERTRYSRISNQTATLIFNRWSHLLRFDSNRLPILPGLPCLPSASATAGCGFELRF